MVKHVIYVKMSIILMRKEIVLILIFVQKEENLVNAKNVLMVIIFQVQHTKQHAPKSKIVILQIKIVVYALFVIKIIIWILKMENANLILKIMNLNIVKFLILD